MRDRNPVLCARGQFVIPEPASTDDLNHLRLLFSYLPSDKSSPPVKISLTQTGSEELNLARFDCVGSILSTKVYSFHISLGNTALPERLIDYLSNPYMDMQGVFRWHFPNMTELSILAKNEPFPDDLHRIKRILVERSTFQNGQDALYELPTKLETLALYRWEQAGDAVPGEVKILAELVETVHWGGNTFRNGLQINS